MQLQILGSAAGGGFPQWNCGCGNCRAVRRGDDNARPRRQSSLAVRGTRGGWYLINASPDIREQLELLWDPTSSELRTNPISGVILTDAEIDHTAGLIFLRESTRPIDLYATTAVRDALSDAFPVLKVLEGYCGVRWHELKVGKVLRLPDEDDPAIEVEPFAVPADPPLYMGGGEFSETGLAVGLTLRSTASGRVATYAPALARLDTPVLARIMTSDVVLLDGTFWRNDELTSVGIGSRTAHDMGHLPLSGPDGTLARLQDLDGPRKILIHINNSNPVLLEDSDERSIVKAAGFEVACDGMVIDV